MLLVSWRIADTMVALAAGLAVASFVTLRVARTRLKIAPFLSGSLSRGFLLAFIWQAPPTPGSVATSAGLSQGQGT
jgi:hypothetical protein